MDSQQAARYPEAPAPPRRATPAAEPIDGGVSTRLDGGRSIPREAVARVIARAAELEQESGAAEGTELDERALLEIGEDVGLSPELVRAALDEYSAGMLDRRQRKTLIGPRTLIVERTLPGTLELVEPRLRGYLQDNLFECWRRSGGRSVWRPREGLLASVQRTVKKLANGRVLRDVTEISVGVVEVPAAEGQEPGVRIRLEVEARALREGLIAAALSGAVIGGVGGIAAAVVAIVIGEPLPLLGVPAGGAIAAATYYGPRQAYLRRLEEIEFFLQSGLDRLRGG